jgi:hypothetical protein
VAKIISSRIACSLSQMRTLGSRKKTVLRSQESFNSKDLTNLIANINSTQDMFDAAKKPLK